LDNAELLNSKAWLTHPVRSAVRLIPLRFKEQFNHAFGRPLFDLTFYLRFQPQSLALAERVVSPFRYIPRVRPARRRLVLVTPHLGLGGAEAVLLDAARAVDRNDCEVLLIATQSRDARWQAHWQECVDHIYDLRQLVDYRNVEAALLSIITSWNCDTLLVQNALPCYSVIPHLRRWLPEIRVFDLVHAVGQDWDIVTSVAAVSEHIDMRVAVSESVRTHLVRAGVPPQRIKVIRNGVDLTHFTAQMGPPSPDVGRILFAGRLDSVKRPMLLVDIAKALVKRRGTRGFQFVVAGDGPEGGHLRSAVRRAGIQHLFRFMGCVPDLAPELAGAALLVITSSNEGVPMVLLEALASGKPVVASKVGAIAEVLDETAGFAIERGEAEAEAFATAIDTLLSDPELREEMGRRGRRKVEMDYDKATSGAAFRELLSRPSPDLSVIAEAPHRPAP
jgi:glycosyltransferase involved in cell wall biosynthesis